VEFCIHSKVWDSLENTIRNFFSSILENYCLCEANINCSFFMNNMASNIRARRDWYSCGEIWSFISLKTFVICVWSHILSRNFNCWAEDERPFNWSWDTLSHGISGCYWPWLGLSFCNWSV
jgi:hypothetical protein